MITGGVHGDEFEPIAAIRRLIGSFSGSDGDLQLKSGTLTLVPIVNEAAFLRGARTAEDGIGSGPRVPG